jgi:anti-anti-sigma factor
MAKEAPGLIVDTHQDVTTVTVDMDNLLGIPEVNRVAAELKSIVEKGAKRLVIDLSKVKYAGSAALGMLLSLDQDLKSAGGRLVLASTGNLEGLLKVSRTRGVFTVAPDLEAAARLC